MAQRIQVKLGSRSYPVRVTVDGAGMVASELARLRRPWFVVSDRRVARYVWPSIARRLRRRSVTVPRLLLVPEGERAKSLAVLERLAAALLRRGAGRDAVVVALGGGAVGDLAGFTAATYLRGIDWIAVPTTLLAMVDASIGGKTAVDLDGVKNAVGAFHQPVAVWAGTDFLRSLPPRQRRSGLAEVVKYGMIADRTMFEWLEDDPRGWRRARPADDARLVARCARIKAEFVTADERETGRRAALNFGHTLGHVLEGAGGWSHGEAVGLGMLAACDIGAVLGVNGATLRPRLQRLLSDLGLPVRARRLPAMTAARRRMRADKKARERVPRLVLTPRIGAVSVGHRVPEALALRALRDLGDHRPAPRRFARRAAVRG